MRPTSVLRRRSPATAASACSSTAHPTSFRSSQREELVRFLFDRIEAMRATDGEESLERLLGQVLDYRQWFCFDLQVRMPDGALVPFTRRRKDIGSGGEREVLLHLPLLAAAA